MKFVVHTTESPPAAATEDLKAAKTAFGFLPNLLGVMAEAPIALKAYLDFTELLGKASFDGCAPAPRNSAIRSSDIRPRELTTSITKERKATIRRNPLVRFMFGYEK